MKPTLFLWQFSRELNSWYRRIIIDYCWYQVKGTWPNGEDFIGMIIGGGEL